MKLATAPKEAWAGGLVNAARNALIALSEDGVEGVDANTDDMDDLMDDLYEITVVLNAPIVAKFSGESNDYEFVWTGARWERVTE